MNEPFFLDFPTWALAFSANLLGHIAFYFVLALFLSRIGARPWQWLLVAIVIVLSFDRHPIPFERFPVLDHKAALVAILLLYLATDANHQKAAALFAGVVGLVIGYLLVDKGTYILAGLALVLVFLAFSLNRTRALSFAALVGGMFAGFLGLWVLAGQSIANVPGYFRGSYEIIAGYTAGESWVRESGVAHGTVFLALGVAVLVSTGLGLLITLWRRDWPVFRLLLLTSPVLYFAFKNSYVRFDEGHALAFWALAAVLQGLVLVRALTGIRASGPTPALIAALTVVGAVVLVGGVGPWLGNVPGFEPTFGFPDNLAGNSRALSLFLHPDLRVDEEAQVNEAIRATYPLPPDVVARLREGTVSVVPTELQVPIGYGLQWDPQPVLQMYVAYRPYLDHLDAEHFTGPRAPRFVLLSAETIDQHYPLFDGPETYRAIFQNYAVLEQVSSLVVLERRPDAPNPQEVPAGAATGRLGEWIQVPNHGNQRIYGRVHVDYSVLGQAMYLLTSPPELYIRIQYGGGQVSPAFRFVPAISADGLDLSAYAPEISGIERIALGQFDQPIEAIQITSSSPASAYRQEVQVSYFTQGAG